MTNKREILSKDGIEIRCALIKLYDINYNLIDTLVLKENFSYEQFSELIDKLDFDECGVNNNPDSVFYVDGKIWLKDGSLLTRDYSIKEDGVLHATWNHIKIYKIPDELLQQQ